MQVARRDVCRTVLNAANVKIAIDDSLGAEAPGGFMKKTFPFWRKVFFDLNGCFYLRSGWAALTLKKIVERL